MAKKIYLEWYAYNNSRPFMHCVLCGEKFGRRDRIDFIRRVNCAGKHITGHKYVKKKLDFIEQEVSACKPCYKILLRRER